MLGNYDQNIGKGARLVENARYTEHLTGTELVYDIISLSVCGLRSTLLEKLHYHITLSQMIPFLNLLLVIFYQVGY